MCPEEMDKCVYGALETKSMVWQRPRKSKIPGTRNLLEKATGNQQRHQQQGHTFKYGP